MGLLPSTVACLGPRLQTGIPPGWAVCPVPVPRSPAPPPPGALRRTCQCLKSQPQAVGDPPHVADHPTALQGKCPQETLQVDCLCQSLWISHPWGLAPGPPTQQAFTGALPQESPEGNTLHMLLLSDSQLGVALSLQPLSSLLLGSGDHRLAATQPLMVCLLCVHALCVPDCLLTLHVSPHNSRRWVSYSRQVCI